MSRLNIVKTLNQLEEETFTSKEVENLNHPYYGLKDERGSLTRFPEEFIAKIAHRF